ncbi:MAG: tRNA 2-thiouridine(34) synthase MnmA [Candidatus Paceibacterota bacterium]
MSIASGKKIRVVCAMSGGVDSAVSAALLVKAGFEVIGVFMKFWVDEDRGGERKSQTLPSAEESDSSAGQSEQRARQTALQLGIPFYVLDVGAQFKKLIVDKFIAATKKGMTPNPCVLCNKEIKFGLLAKKALAMDADYVATGHYAQIKKTKDGIYHLLKGKDRVKDQSYFLWRLDQKQLGKIIFPVGAFEKSEIRSLAKKWKLPSANTPESQEVCFVNGDIDKFLEKHCGIKPGNIVDMVGKTIGHHNGLWFYTIGQRKGIRLSGGPYFVVRKNRAKNELVVTDNSKDLLSRNILLGNAKWVVGVPPLPFAAKVKIRYRGKEIRSVLKKFGKAIGIDFSRPQNALAFGQSAVFYKGLELIGGGIIR